MRHDATAVTPFLKWPGGKRWARGQLTSIIRKHLRGRYFEPFLGGGAVFFGVAPERAVLSDINADLINAYQMVQKHPRALIQRLKQIPVNGNQYEIIRGSTGGSKLERAVRFLFLNRTCFGGIYRLNSTGEFNVPYGGGDRTPSILWERDLLSQASRSLRSAELHWGDFENFIDASRRGDVVFCDPTYTVAHDKNGFVRYNEKNFAWSDQERLATAVERAACRDVTVLVMNAHHQSIHRLFSGGKRVVLERISRVSASVSARRIVRESLFIWSRAASR